MIDNYFKQIDGLDSIANRSKGWLDDHEDEKVDLNNTLIGFNQLLFAIPTFGGSGGDYRDVDPWYYLFIEAEQELDSAILLLFSGFYKTGIRSLRSFIEMYMLGLHHSIIENEKSFQKWLAGESHTPSFGNLVSSAKKDENTKTLDDKLDWSSEIKDLYSELSGFTHTQGSSNTYTALRNTNQVSFSERGLRSGIGFTLKAIRLVSMGFVTRFPMALHPLPLFDKFAFNPPVSGFLDNGQVEMIKELFTDNVSAEIEKICKSDGEASSLAEAIKSSKDLSEEEKMESLKGVLQTEPLNQQKEEVVELIKKGKVGKAFTIVQSLQRLVGRTVIIAVYNPFYFDKESKKSKSETL